MAIYDFSAPYVGVAIHDRETGQRTPLWTNDYQGTAVRPSNVSADTLSYPWVTEATIEVPLGDNPPNISVQLEPPFRDGMKFLDEVFEWGRAELHVQLGYTGGGDRILSRPYIGTIMQPDISIGDSITITLNAVGLGSFSAWRQRGGRAPTEGETIRQLMERVAKGPGTTRELKLDFGDADRNRDVRSRLDSELTSWHQGNKTDWLALWELANMVRCSLLLVDTPEPGTLQVVPREGRFSAPPTRTFRLYDFAGGQLGGVKSQQALSVEEPGEYPILNFSTSNMAVWLPGSVRGQVMREMGDDDRAVAEELLTDATVAPPRTGEGAVAPPPEHELAEPDSATNDGMEQLPGDPTDPPSLEGAISEYVNYASMGLQIEVESVGVPDMLPGEVVAIYGVGNRFSAQNYAVIRTTHTIGSGGYSTSFVAVSNVGRALEGLSPVGTVNVQTPDTGTAQDSVDVGAREDAVADSLGDLSSDNAVLRGIGF